MTPEQAVEILTGGGVEPFNIQFSGDPGQLGLLTEASGDFPFESGITLSTENVQTLACSNGTGIAGTSGEPDLLTIANSVPPLIGQSFSVSSVNDVAILEFDFVAAGNYVSFNYTFGSDEYLEWVNSSFNDVFAFFLSGPGIVGDFDSPPGFPNGAINLAYVPESDPELPITISSVNNTLNNDYYINNPSNVDVCQDGYTTSLTAEHIVLCGETYHIKLAIADGSDTALESIVCLEAGSFDSNGVFITADPTVEGSFEFANDTILVEGCNEGYFTLFRADASTEEEIFFEVSGTAEDADFADLFPSSVIMEVGQVAYELPIQAIEDGLVEPLEDITLSYSFINTCGDLVTSTASLWVADHQFPVLAPEDIILYCGSSYLTVDVEDGYEPFNWEWGFPGEEPFSTNEGIIVDITEDTQYYVIATDPCGGMDSVIVNALTSDEDPPPLELVNGPWTVECPGDFATIDPIIEGGAPNYFYFWPDLNGWEGETYTTSFSEDVTYELIIADQCNQIETFEIEITVPEYVPIVITAEDVNSPCAGQEVTLTASASEGFAPYEYFWGTFGEGPSITVAPDETTGYQVEVVDNCGNIQSEIVQAIVGSPDVIVIGELEENCVFLEQPLSVSGGLAPYNYSFDFDLIGITEQGNIYGNEVGILEFEVIDACGQTATGYLPIMACETVVPDIFTPGNDDMYNDTFIIEGLDGFPNSKLMIFNRWGGVVYENSNYDNMWDGDELPEGTYYYVLERPDGNAQSGYFQLVRAEAE